MAITMLPLPVLLINPIKEVYNSGNNVSITAFALCLSFAINILFMIGFSIDKSLRKARARREAERFSLLKAISHDFRTPLNSIICTCSGIIGKKNRLGIDTDPALIEDINENAKWMLRIAENLLSVTRVSDSALKTDKTAEVAEEVAAQSVSIIRKRYPNRKIIVKCPDELLIIPMNPTLISQVIINLLENSIKNSTGDSLISLEIKKLSSFAEFTVDDFGRGIPIELLKNLFDAFSSAENEAPRRGIGLSVCKIIIQAHGGNITGHNKPEGGARFSFCLPLKESDFGGTKD